MKTSIATKAARGFLMSLGIAIVIIGFITLPEIIGRTLASLAMIVIGGVLFVINLPDSP